MPRLDTNGFNKEKLVFLLVAGATAVSLFLFLSSAPASLRNDDPLGTLAPPEKLEGLSIDEQREERWYVDGPNRKRKTPFAPGTEYVKAKPAAVVPSGFLPPPPPPPKEQPKSDVKKDYDPKDLDVQIEFSGVLVRGSDVCALVRLKDGSGSRQLHIGDTIPELKYKVTRIEKQAVWFVDGEGRPFVLKDDDQIEGAPDDAGAKSDKSSATPKPQPSSAQPQPSKPADTPQKGRKEHTKRPRPAKQPKPAN